MKKENPFKKNCVINFLLSNINDYTVSQLITYVWCVYVGWSHMSCLAWHMLLISVKEGVRVFISEHHIMKVSNQCYGVQITHDSQLH